MTLATFATADHGPITVRTGQIALAHEHGGVTKIELLSGIRFLIRQAPEEIAAIPGAALTIVAETRDEDGAHGEARIAPAAIAAFGSGSERGWMELWLASGRRLESRLSEQALYGL